MAAAEEMGFVTSACYFRYRGEVNTSRVLEKGEQVITLAVTYKGLDTALG